MALSVGTIDKGLMVWPWSPCYYTGFHGLTLVPWQSRCSPTWDVTIVHTLRLTCHRVLYRQEAQRQRLQWGNQPSTAVCHLAFPCLLSSGCWDPWSAGGWCTTFPDRDWQEINASYSRSAGRHVSISANFCGNSEFQCHVSDQLVGCFWVPIVTIPDTDLHFANF